MSGFCGISGRDETGLQFDVLVHGRQVEICADAGQISIGSEEIGRRREPLLYGTVVLFGGR